MSAKTVDVRYILAENGMRYMVKSPAKNIRAHILLPEGRKCHEVRVNGEKQRFSKVSVGDSRYVDFTITADGIADIEILF